VAAEVGWAAAGWAAVVAAGWAAVAVVVAAAVGDS